jgi:Tol biopolymer transport system component
MLLSHPVWSPDGATIAFDDSVDGGPAHYVYLVDSAGGRPVRLTHVSPSSNPSFSPDGSRLAFLGPSGIELVRRDGSAERNLVTTGSFPEPQWAPRGSKILYLCRDGRGICVIDAKGNGPPVLIPVSLSSLQFPAWSPDGSWITVTCGTSLCIVTADGRRSRLLARAVYANGDASPTVWSPDGATIALVCPGNVGQDQICVVGKNGTGLRIVVPNSDFHTFMRPLRFATPKTVEFEVGSELDTVRIDGTHRRRVVPHMPGCNEIAWSPDGTKIACTHIGGGQGGLYVMNANGTGLTKLA